jgi:hypothetical protein
MKKVESINARDTQATLGTVRPGFAMPTIYIYPLTINFSTMFINRQIQPWWD